jgi:DNA (cytosine-5)-methyltransferase 1
VALEQVPTVLPVWEACAEVMREWGYEVKVEILNAEQYGVPQTRKRAILVARRGGPVHMPKPTHSRYYSRTPEKLDPGVKKWVSMAEALGWRGLTSRPSPTITGGGTEAGGAEPIAKFHERYTGIPEWAGATDRLSPDEAAVLQSYPTHMAASGTSCQIVDPRPIDHPARTITGAGNASFGNRATRAAGPGDKDPDSRLLTPDEAGVIQTYERPFIWCGTKTKQFLQIGNAVPPLLAEHILAALIGITEGR